jgi:hypothetical protein
VARRSSSAAKVAALTGALVLLGASSGTHAATTTHGFQTPSHNIQCLYQDGASASVFCGIKSGLKPPPPRKRCKEGDPTDKLILMTKTGRASEPSCWGDPGPIGYPGLPVLAYGHSRVWAAGGLRCSSSFEGLTCRNAAGHGFFLSRARSRRF